MVFLCFPYTSISHVLYFSFSVTSVDHSRSLTLSLPSMTTSSRRLCVLQGTMSVDPVQ